MIASQNDGTVPCGIDTSNRDRYQRLEVPNRAGGCPRHDFCMSDDLDAEARGDAGTPARRRLWGMCPRTAAFLGKMSLSAFRCLCGGGEFVGICSGIPYRWISLKDAKRENQHTGRWSKMEQSLQALSKQAICHCPEEFPICQHSRFDPLRSRRAASSMGRSAGMQNE